MSALVQTSIALEELQGRLTEDQSLGASHLPTKRHGVDLISSEQGIDIEDPFVAQIPEFFRGPRQVKYTLGVQKLEQGFANGTTLDVQQAADQVALGCVRIK